MVLVATLVTGVVLTVLVGTMTGVVLTVLVVVVGATVTVGRCTPRPKSSRDPTFEVIAEKETKIFQNISNKDCFLDFTKKNYIFYL